jgi:hypothetical protein
VKGGSVAAPLLLAWVSFFGADARAEGPPCPSGGGPWVRVVLEGPSFDEPLRASVLQQIATDLRRSKLEVCGGGAQGTPAAELQVVLVRATALSIELRDHVTGERVSREISLAGVPSDALGLSIAVTVEELLHASWTQDGAARSSSADPAPASGAPATPSAARPVAPSSLPTSRPAAEVPSSASVSPEHEAPGRRAGVPPTEVYLRGAGEVATRGGAALGADLGFSWGGRATVGARAGFRVGPEVSSAHGTIEMREAILGLVGAVALAPREAVWGGEIVFHAELLDVAFDGVAAPPAHALGGSALGFLLAGGLGGWVRIAPSWSLVGEATGGAPLHAVTASDSGTVVTGVRGLVLGGALGVATRL